MRFGSPRDGRQSRFRRLTWRATACFLLTLAVGARGQEVPQVEANPGPLGAKPLGGADVSARTEAEQALERGYVLYRSGELDKALKEFDRAVSLQPLGAPCYFARGRVYCRKDELDRALAEFNRAIALAPDGWMCYHWRSSVYYEKKVRL